MQVSRLKIENFRGIKSAELLFDGHTLLVGRNNVGKSTICEALELVLSPERLHRQPPVDEFDFYNGRYLDEDGATTVPLRVEVVLTQLTEEVARLCMANLEYWHTAENRLLESGELDGVDAEAVVRCLRLTTIGVYDKEDDQFTARTIYSAQEVADLSEVRSVPSPVKRAIGFLYLRALRTGSRALTLERGSLLDIILRMKELRTGMWERIRTRLAKLDPPIDEDASELGPILDEIEGRLADYVETGDADRATRLFVSQLTREHLRKTIAFFLSIGRDELPVPFAKAGTGTLNVLVLALLTFIADIKRDVIFAMEEPETALPPHTQRRIAKYVMEQTSQCFITSHSPYVIERFEPERIVRLVKAEEGRVQGIPVKLPDNMKPKSYRQAFRRSLAEAMLGQAVVVGEGLTERDALIAAAVAMEQADPTLFPLDVAGVTIIESEGDGNLERLGEFFRSIGVPAFAFFDRKQRTAAQAAGIHAIYEIACEQPHQGAERLLVAETPIERQWEFLLAIRAEDEDRRFGIPAARPDSDDEVRGLTFATLRGLKGAGASARLIELCRPDELPSTLCDFLLGVYQRFPRPERRHRAEAPADGPQRAA